MGEELPPELAAEVDRAVLRLRAKIVQECRELADRNEEVANLIRHCHDEACATSMEFSALRLRRIADRLQVEGKG